ncbi:MAG: thioredoxin family protein [Saprospiraceae bacterium]
MSRLILMFIMFGLAVSALNAQVTKGRESTPKTSLAPSTSSVKNGKSNPATSPPQSNDRGKTSEGAQQRSTTTFGNTGAKSSSQDRAARPSSTKINRPATYAPPTNATATKGGANGNVKKATLLKPAERGTVNWITLEQALEKNKTEKRKIFLDMYTDRCGWCKHMDSTTFVNAAVAKYLNEHFYPVKFNAEQEKDIVFKDKTYKFKKNGTRGYHELAAFWLNNRLSFPTVVFLDENQQVIQPIPGYQDAAKMEAIINYFGSESHKKTPWEAYEKNFSNKK